MGRRFVEGTSYRKFLNLNPQKQTQLVTELVQHEAGGVFLAEHSSSATGMLGLTLARNPFDDTLTAMEHFWWVEPSHRGSMTAVRLLKTGEEWAKAKGAERMVMIAPNPGVGTFLERLRYEYVESLYQRTL